RFEPPATAGAALAMRERDMARLVRRERKRDTAKLRLHRVDGTGLDVDRRGAEIRCPRRQRLEPVRRAHGLVTPAVEGNLAQPLGPLLGRSEEHTSELQSRD